METRTQTPDKSKSVKSVLDPYLISFSELEVTCLLGSGCYGKVYLGKRNKKSVAIKEAAVFRKAAKIYEEIEIMKKMAEWQVPNVVKFVGYTIVSRQYSHIVMEYMSQGDLSVYINNHTQTCDSSWENIRYPIMRNITNGLLNLHKYNIIHCDLKPANILLDDDKHAKIGDFGASKLIDDEIRYVGTPKYMAPEIAQEKLPYNEKSDMYSLAITFVVIANWNTHIYSTYTNRKTLVAFVAQEGRPEIDATCPPSIAKLIKFCWQTNRDKRLSAHQVLKQLDADIMEINNKKCSK